MADREWIVGIMASVRPFLFCGPGHASATARRQEEGTSVILCGLPTADVRRRWPGPTLIHPVGTLDCEAICDLLDWLARATATFLEPTRQVSASLINGIPSSQSRPGFSSYHLSVRVFKAFSFLPRLFVDDIIRNCAINHINERPFIGGIRSTVHESILANSRSSGKRIPPVWRFRG